MSSCPNCGKEIAEGAVVCKHCGHKFGKPARPTGVTILGVLSMLGGIIGLIGLAVAMSQPAYSVEQSAVVLGMHVSIPLFVVISIAANLLSIYCGIGFLRQQRLARTIYIYLGSFGIISTLLGVFGQAGNLRGDAATVFYVIILITLAYYGLILRYVVRRKDYFVN